MFAVASILHDRKDVGIEAIFELLRDEGFPVVRHVWKGLSVSVQQIRYSTGCDIVIQSEEEDFSREELEELAQLFDCPGVEVDRLRRCNAKIDILAFQPDATEDQYESWIAAGIRAEVPRDACLDNPDVLGIAKAIAKALDGFVFDNTENKFL
jgi:hypothetical protein